MVGRLAPSSRAVPAVWSSGGGEAASDHGGCLLSFGGQVPRAVDVITCSVGSGRREAAMSSVHHGWFSDNKEWIEYIVAVVVLWLLAMTAVSVFDLRSAG